MTRQQSQRPRRSPKRKSAKSKIESSKSKAPKSKIESRWSHLAQRMQIDLAADIITIAAGSAELIKMLLEVWQSKPFGPAKIGPSYPYFMNWPPTTLAGSSIDWRTARQIFDLTTEILEDRNRTYSPDESAAQSTELSKQIEHLRHTMQPTVYNQLCERVDEER